jgi:hypothetical protein
LHHGHDLPAGRENLARELTAAGHIHSCHDFCRVAAHLQAGRSGELILAMEELERWTAARAWVEARL